MLAAVQRSNDNARFKVEMTILAKMDEESKNVVYVRLNKAHWQLSGAGVGALGVLLFGVAAMDPNVEIGTLGLLILMFAILFVFLPFNSYITYWKADGEGFRFKNILKNVFIPANDVRQVRIVIHSLGEFLSVQGSRKEIGVPLREDGVSELMEFIMKNYPENVWFAGKDFMVRFVDVRKRKDSSKGMRTQQS